MHACAEVSRCHGKGKKAGDNRHMYLRMAEDRRAFSRSAQTRLAAERSAAISETPLSFALPSSTPRRSHSSNIVLKPPCIPTAPRSKACDKRRVSQHRAPSDKTAEGSTTAHAAQAEGRRKGRQGARDKKRGKEKEKCKTAGDEARLPPAKWCPQNCTPASQPCCTGLQQTRP